MSQTIFDCIKHAKVEDLERLVKQGSSLNEPQKTMDKFTPLHCAAYFGSLEVILIFFINLTLMI